MRVERINTPEQYQELLEKHRETHSPTGRPLFPTHMIRMEGEVVGSLCLSSPTVHMSMDTVSYTHLTLPTTPYV